MQDAPGQTRRQTDVMDQSRANALAVMLGLDFAVDAPLPPFFHQIYFWDAQPASALGPDGHPKTGGHIPDMGLPHRMWAGGRLDWRAPLVADRVAEKLTVVERAVHKQGRSGALGFVTLRHDIRQNGLLCLTEWQDLVYRAQTGRAAVPAAPDSAEISRPVRFSTTDLFRYSALTFNGHRIHYDLDYARDVEGYGGLVVHGPLLAQLLLLFAGQDGEVAEFTFRATAPLMHFETATLCQNGSDVWVRAADGRQNMQASVTYRA